MADNTTGITKEKLELLVDSLELWQKNLNEKAGLSKKDALALIKQFSAFSKTQNIEEAVNDPELLEFIKQFLTQLDQLGPSQTTPTNEQLAEMQLAAKRTLEEQRKTKETQKKAVQESIERQQQRVQEQKETPRPQPEEQKTVPETASVEEYNSPVAKNYVFVSVAKTGEVQKTDAAVVTKTIKDHVNTVGKEQAARELVSAIPKGSLPPHMQAAVELNKMAGKVIDNFVSGEATNYLGQAFFGSQETKAAAMALLNSQGFDIQSIPLPEPGSIVVNDQKRSVALANYSLAPVEPVSASTLILAGFEDVKSKDPKKQKEGKLKILAGYGIDAERIIAMSSLPLTSADKEEIRRLLNEESNIYLRIMTAQRAKSPYVRELLFRSASGSFDFNVGLLPRYRGVRGFFLRAADNLFGFGKGAQKKLAAATAKGIRKVASKQAGKAAIAAGAGFLGGPVASLLAKLAAETLGRLLSWIQRKIKESDIKWTDVLAGAGVVAGALGGSALLTVISLSVLARRVLAAPAVAISIAKPLIISIISIPIAIAVILFIINTGAYIVPNGSPIGTIEPPEITTTEDCPKEWPFNVSYSFASQQGPYALFGTHRNAEAVDLSVYDSTPIIATHHGIVTAFPFGSSSAYGNYVQVQSVCNGHLFFSRYGHLKAIKVPTGKEVNRGDIIGYSDSTGNSTGSHLHYEFRYVNSKTDLVGSPTGGSPSNFFDNPPYMAEPFIPYNFPRGCTANCIQR